MESEAKQVIADKHDVDKPRVELVDPGFILEVAKVLAHGAEKYGADNWRKGLPWMRTYASVLRHMFLWAKGEDCDQESGISHLAHAACNIMFLLEWRYSHRELDNRVWRTPLKEKAQ